MNAMRTLYKSFLASILMGAMCLSCTQLPETTEPGRAEETLYEYTITASQEGSATKAELAEDKTIRWQEEDCITLVKKDEYTRDFSLVSGAGTTSGVFSGTLRSDRERLEDYIAVYPAGEDHHIDNTSEKIVVQWEKNNVGAKAQPATQGGFWPGSALMAGQIDAEGGVAFKNLLAFIKFEVTFPCTSIVFTGNNGETLASDAINFRFDEDGVPTGIAAGKGFGLPAKEYKSVLLEGMDGEDVAAGTYLVAVLPQTLEKGLTITFTSAASGLEFEKKLTKSMDLKRSRMLNIGSYSISTFIGNEFEGLGTAGNPYLIPDLDKLKRLASVFSDSSTASKYYGKHFRQTADIDCLGEKIGIGYTRMAHEGKSLQYYESPFYATYDGDGYTVSNYRIKSITNGVDGARYAGLFTYVLSATIKNLTVQPYAEGGVIYTAKQKGYSGIIQHIGCLVGLATGNRVDATGKTVIQNCHLAKGSYTVQGFTMEDVAGSNYIQELIFGGLVGLSEDSIELTRCTNEADLTLAGGIMTSGMDGLFSTVGGLVGMMFPDEYASSQAYVDMSFCRNYGDVTMAPVNVSEATCGGLIGNVVDSRGANVTLHMWNCVNDGHIKCASGSSAAISYAGGLIGFHDSDGDTGHNPWIYNCLNRGPIDAYGDETSVGGLVGAGYDPDLKVFYSVNAHCDLYSMGSKAKKVGAIVGKETSSWYYHASYCAECYWGQIGSHTYDVMPGTNKAGSSYGDGDYIDCFSFDVIEGYRTDTSYDPINVTIIKRMKAGWYTANSEWKTTDGWLNNAANWIVTAYSDNGMDMLDLDFTTSVGGAKF